MTKLKIQLKAALRGLSGLLPTGWRAWAALLGAILIAAYYAAVLTPLVLNHIVWRDEAQAWLLARDSHSLEELLAHMKYEGHPPLWHLLLYVLAHFTSSVMAMQLLNLLISVATVFIVARWSPFNWVEKFLFSGGYFVLFEYGLLARNYQIGALLLFAFCAVWTHRRGAFLAQGILIGLLCFTNIYAVIIAGPLAGMVALDPCFSRTARRLVAAHPVRFTGAILLMLCAAIASIEQTDPPADSGYYAQWSFQYPGADRSAPENAQLQTYLDQNLAGVWEAFIPTPTTSRNFWNTSILSRTLKDHQEEMRAADSGAPMPPRSGDDQVVANWVITMLAVGALCLAWRPRALIIFLTGSAGILAFMYVKFYGSVRHHGHFYLLFVACLWIAFSHLPSGAGRSARIRQIASTASVFAIAAFLLFGFPSLLTSIIESLFKIELPNALKNYRPELLDILRPYFSWGLILFFLIAANILLVRPARMAAPRKPLAAVAGYAWDAWVLAYRRYMPHTIFLVALLAQVYAANVAVPQLKVAPFSAGQQAALFIQSQLKPGELIVTDMDSHAATVAAYLPGLQFYFTRGNRLGTFNIWDSATRTRDAQTTAREMAIRYDSSMIIMTEIPNLRGPNVQPLKVFGGGIQGDEVYYFYRMNVPPRRPI